MYKKVAMNIYATNKEKKRPKKTENRKVRSLSNQPSGGSRLSCASFLLIANDITKSKKPLPHTSTPLQYNPLLLL